MVDVLGRIVERKRSEVAALRPLPAPPASPTSRSLRSALARDGTRFIMEVKRASPSGHRSAVGLEQAVAAYAPVADAISVLTDGPDFGGSINDLRRVRRQFDGPVLAKDFIVDPVQVTQARSAGADAILAMMSVLDDAGAAAALAEARRLGMDAIVEVHDEAELRRAVALGAGIIGINNRDLRTLQTDLAVTERLAPLVPPDILIVAESGIANHRDVERLASHVDAFLVGSALMASPDIAGAARALVHGRVKLCGVTRQEDVALAAWSGATHLGLIMVPDSPRSISPDAARPLAAMSAALGLKPVGVFRNADPADVVRTADSLGLAAVQLHGNEDERSLKAVRDGLAAGVELWALCPVAAAAAAARPRADRSLFDTMRDGKCGGTGQAFDWSLLRSRPDLPSGFLAGGIGPANARAAARVGAYGLDAGSSVEACPGRKDPAKVEALFAALRPMARCGA